MINDRIFEGLLVQWRYMALTDFQFIIKSYDIDRVDYAIEAIREKAFNEGRKFEKCQK